MMKSPACAGIDLFLSCFRRRLFPAYGVFCSQIPGVKVGDAVGTTDCVSSMRSVAVPCVSNTCMLSVHPVMKKNRLIKTKLFILFLFRDFPLIFVPFLRDDLCDAQTSSLTRGILA